MFQDIVISLLSNIKLPFNTNVGDIIKLINTNKKIIEQISDNKDSAITEFEDKVIAFLIITAMNLRKQYKTNKAMKNMPTIGGYNTLERELINFFAKLFEQLTAKTN